MLTIESLSKTYPNGVEALRNVSLNIPTGLFGLVGPNGAGKSTLMRTVATLQDADQGAITLNGLNVLKQKHEIRKLLGYLPQEFGLYPNQSALTTLDHFATLKGLTHRGERRQQVRALLERTNLWESRGKRVGGFSGGMKQRLGIAIALLGNPSLLIVDEPTAGLDPTERRRFLNLLAEIGEDVVVILSTHIVADVRELCSQVAIISQGEVVFSGEPVEAIAELDGRIWQRSVPKSELDELSHRFRIVSTTMVAGRPQVRICHEGNPGDGFEPAVPDIEDVYFLKVSS